MARSPGTDTCRASPCAKAPRSCPATRSDAWAARETRPVHTCILRCARATARRSTPAPGSTTKASASDHVLLIGHPPVSDGPSQVPTHTGTWPLVEPVLGFMRTQRTQPRRYLLLGKVSKPTAPVVGT